MNKTWITLIIVAIFTIVVVVGYEFYLSFSGQNIEFARPEQPVISPDIGGVQLEYIKSLESKVVVADEELDR